MGRRALRADQLAQDDYLTDGVRLVQILSVADDGFVLAEDVRAPVDKPSPLMKLQDLSQWRVVSREAA